MILALGLVLTQAATVAAPQSATQASQCVAEKLEPSLGVIAQLNDAHLDLNRPRQISQLFLGTDKKLNTVAKALTDSGYKIAEQGNGRLLGVISSSVGVEWVRSTIPKMCAAADAAAVEYDGWDIDVAADHVQTETSK